MQTDGVQWSDDLVFFCETETGLFFYIACGGWSHWISVHCESQPLGSEVVSLQVAHDLIRVTHGKKDGIYLF